MIRIVSTGDYGLLSELPDTRSTAQIGCGITELSTFQCRCRVLSFRDFYSSTRRPRFGQIMPMSAPGFTVSFYFCPCQPCSNAKLLRLVDTYWNPLFVVRCPILKTRGIAAVSVLDADLFDYHGTGLPALYKPGSLAS
jgi:hypothetical protein